MFQNYVCTGICLFVTLTRGLRFIRVDGTGVWLFILLLRRKDVFTLFFRLFFSLPLGKNVFCQFWPPFSAKDPPSSQSKAIWSSDFGSLDHATSAESPVFFFFFFIIHLPWGSDRNAAISLAFFPFWSTTIGSLIICYRIVWKSERDEPENRNRLLTNSIIFTPAVSTRKAFSDCFFCICHVAMLGC